MYFVYMSNNYRLMSQNTKNINYIKFYIYDLCYYKSKFSSEFYNTNISELKIIKCDEILNLTPYRQTWS